MLHPALALTVFAVFVAAAALLFWPRLGLVARLDRMSELSERVLLEDALKHLYMSERIGRDSTLESLAGRLEVTTGRAAALLSRLAESGLVRTDASTTRLTDDGRESALRLVRAHRLWERYLADRTGVPPSEWHAEAERMEHALSPQQTEELAARLGHPARDPHGDPIPTAGGELPAVERLSLAGVEPGSAAEIVHLEDEPHEIYEALLADGLGLGTRVSVLERSDRHVRLRARGREWHMDLLVARNVTVRRLPAGEDVDEPVETLHDLGPGQRGRVLGLSPACQGSQRRRLLDLGVVRGTVIEAALASATGDPVAYLIRGALIALRREQAEWVRIEMLADQAEVA
jgi:DtxR family Mn-dependent transcriptional regulator